MTDREPSFERRRTDIRLKQKQEAEYDAISDEERETVGSRSRLKAIRTTTRNQLKTELRDEIRDYFQKREGTRFNLYVWTLDVGFGGETTIQIDSRANFEQTYALPKDAAGNVLMLRIVNNQSYRLEFDEVDDDLTVVRFITVELDDNNIELERKEHGSAMVQKKKSKKAGPKLRFVNNEICFVNSDSS